MTDLSKHITNVPNSLFQGFQSYLLLEFYDYPYLSVETSPSGSLFINYYVDGENGDCNHLITEISKEKLNLFLQKEIKLHEIFHKPESGNVFYANYNISHEINSLSLIDHHYLIGANLIPLNHELDYEDEITNKEVDLILISKQRNKILVDVYLQANSLQSSLKLWALKSFFIPFSELLRNSLLNNSKEYTPQNLDKKVNLGINQFAINSLASTIEINYNENLFGENSDLDNICKLFSIFNSKEKNDLLGSFDKFSNKKIISEYLKILNVIIKNDASLVTKVVAPNQYFEESYFTKSSAQKIKNIIIDYLPDVEDVEEIRGYLLELSFDKTNPSFSMDASLEDLKYKGKIDIELKEIISQKEFTFLSKEYVFTIHTLYRQETSNAPERISRTLKNITEFISE